MRFAPIYQHIIGRLESQVIYMAEKGCPGLLFGGLYARSTGRNYTLYGHIHNPAIFPVTRAQIIHGVTSRPEKKKSNGVGPECEVKF
jgi:hypothetical protein